MTKELKKITQEEMIKKIEVKMERHRLSANEFETMDKLNLHVASADTYNDILFVLRLGMWNIIDSDQLNYELMITELGKLGHRYLTNVNNYASPENQRINIIKYEVIRKLIFNLTNSNDYALVYLKFLPINIQKIPMHIYTI